MLMISLQISTRRDSSDSVTNLDDVVRPMNPSNATQKSSRSFSGKTLWRFTSLDLKKPGMASKNLSHEASSPRVLIVQSKMRMSTSNDSSDDVISSAAFILALVI